ncbi:hypothetical protein BC938DRAFT_481914 [Jimgerdemannia flammicorona]|uniref:Uncharacterized protein n=1 Tax=Jimgerdemannia flammicorona TaxID=994334 RepID=A0A433QF46_9FUNG|nr:hypothetical protein BC938DRAFT_481914 [Jimgerdemannia flammicorona]
MMSFGVQLVYLPISPSEMPKDPSHQSLKAKITPFGNPFSYSRLWFPFAPSYSMSLTLRNDPSPLTGREPNSAVVSHALPRHDVLPRDVNNSERPKEGQWQDTEHVVHVRPGDKGVIGHVQMECEKEHDSDKKD